MDQKNDIAVGRYSFADGKLIDSRREYLKAVAVLTMLIDHVGMIFFTKITALRIIGRAALPIYAYLVATGLDCTHNKFRYFIRLVMLALIAQYGFALHTPGKYNIIFTYALFIPVYYL